LLGHDRRAILWYKVQPLSTLPWGDYHDLKAPATDVVSITILYQGIEVRYITHELAAVEERMGGKDSDVCEIV